jgi:uncharacterized protein
MLSKRYPVRSAVAKSLVAATLSSICHVIGYASPVSGDVPAIKGDAEKGGAGSEIELARAYSSGTGVPQDMRKAAYWFERAAGMGNPVAQNQIGYFYQVGIGVAPDPVRAVHWYQLSSANGLTSAKVNLANAFLWGIGVNRDPKIAEKLLREAARKGDSVAVTYLGDMYFRGLGVPKDEREGERWYERAIKLHSSLASFRMGIILSGPGGHSRDLKRALLLLRSSASAGFVPAKYSAGLLLVNNPALCTSPEEAVALLKEAAAAGTWKSSIVLGTLARDGKWLPQDSRQAYLHFRVGELQGGEAAKAIVKNDLEVLSAKISSADRLELDEQAKVWARDHSEQMEMIYKDGKKREAPTIVTLEAHGPAAQAGFLTSTTTN